MPSWMELSRRDRRARGKCASLMVTTFGVRCVQRALDRGAVGFVKKTAPARQLLEAIRRKRPPKDCARSIRNSPRSMRSRKPISAREVSSARFLRRGPWEAGSGLYLSAGTVRSYVSSAMVIPPRTAEALKGSNRKRVVVNWDSMVNSYGRRQRTGKRYSPHLRHPEVWFLRWKAEV